MGAGVVAGDEEVLGTGLDGLEELEGDSDAEGAEGAEGPGAVEHALSPSAAQTTAVTACAPRRRPIP